MSHHNEIATIEFPSFEVPAPPIPVPVDLRGAAEATSVAVGAANSLSTNSHGDAASSPGISGTSAASATATVDSAAPPAPITLSICNYFLKGNCLRINCRFFHGTEEQLREHNRRLEVEGRLEEVTADPEAHSATANMQSLALAAGKKPIVCLSYLSGSCHRNDCRFVHLPPHVRPLPNSVCSFFEGGVCHRSYCRYFHGPPEVLRKMQAAGYSMYNPMTNEPYDKVPGFTEPQVAPPVPQLAPALQTIATPISIPHPQHGLVQPPPMSVQVGVQPQFTQHIVISQPHQFSPQPHFASMAVQQQQPQTHYVHAAPQYHHQHAQAMPQQIVHFAAPPPAGPGHPAPPQMQPGAPQVVYFVQQHPGAPPQHHYVQPAQPQSQPQIVQYVVTQQ